MKKLYLILIALSLALPVYAADEDARFDWSLGKPTITAETESVDNCSARFDWSLGQPTVVLDATDSCPAEEAPSVSGESRLYIQSQIIINGEVRVP